MITRHVNVIGAGFAGIECALFLAKHGVRVHVFNSSSSPYECDNLTCDAGLKNWKNVLKEAKILGSELADEEAKLRSKSNSCQAKKVIEFGLNLLKNNKNIDYFDICINELNPKEINVIATGPRTEGGLYEYLEKKLGTRRCFNCFPVYPVVSNIDESLCYTKCNDNDNRYIALNYQEYIDFCNAIIEQRNLYSQEVGFKDYKYDYECIEHIVEKNRDAIKNHCMQPILLNDLHEKPYAVIKLNKCRNGYVIDGFCSKLPDFYQQRIIRSLKPLKNAKVVRTGKPTPNAYINAPMVINCFGQADNDDNLFFAGNISGIFGHIESMCSGLYVGHNVLNYILGKHMEQIPECSIIGRIMNNLLTQNSVKFVPTIENYDIIENENSETVLNELRKYEEEFNGKYV